VAALMSWPTLFSYAGIIHMSSPAAVKCAQAVAWAPISLICLRVQPAQAEQAVGVAAVPQIIQARHCLVRGGDDDLAALFIA